MKTLPTTVLFTFHLSALAAPSWAQTYTAASCRQSDGIAVINGPTHTAVNGDTINILAGSCPWILGITVPSNIEISTGLQICPSRPRLLNPFVKEERHL